SQNGPADPSIAGSSGELKRTSRSVIPSPLSALIRCSTVRTPPNEVDLVVSVTDSGFATTHSSPYKNRTPSAAGLRLTSTGTPECSPNPFSSAGWARVLLVTAISVTSAPQPKRRPGMGAHD